MLDAVTMESGYSEDRSRFPLFNAVLPLAVV